MKNLKHRYGLPSLISFVLSTSVFESNAIAGDFLSCLGRGNQSDVSLILAVDVSTSIDTIEFEQQRSGYQSAFMNPRITHLVRNQQCVAIGVVLWSNDAKVAFPLRLIRSDADLEQLVYFFKNLTPVRGRGRTDSIHYSLRIGDRPNSVRRGVTLIGNALRLSREALLSSPLSSLKKVIDVSGDGAHSNLPSQDFNEYGRVTNLEQNIRLCKESDITINGLPIENLRRADGRPSDQAVYLAELGFKNLTDYYKARVKSRFGFVETARSFEEFPEALVRKLEREMSPALM